MTKSERDDRKKERGSRRYLSPLGVTRVCYSENVEPDVLVGNNTTRYSPRQAKSTPLLTGGVLQCEKVYKFKGIDWLSLSSAKIYADELLEQSRETDGMTFAKGFKDHQMRDCLGGKVARHWNPHTKSHNWGSNYELWCWTGENAQASIAMNKGLNQKHNRCTRIDVAFDLQCAADLTPEEIVEGCREVWEKRGFEQGVSGQGAKKNWTAYIGTRGAERRIRIYRKDIENPHWQFGPFMRIELELHGQSARSVYFNALQDKDTAYGIACSHIEEMCGLHLTDDMSAIPEREILEQSELPEKIAFMVNQYGFILDIIRERGIDLDQILDVRKTKISRMSKNRQFKALEQAQAIPNEELEQMAIEIYRKRF